MDLIPQIIKCTVVKCAVDNLFLNLLNRVFQMKPKNSLDRLLLERTSLAGIVRVTGVSEGWFQSYVNQKYEQIAQQVDVKKPGP